MNIDEFVNKFRLASRELFNNFFSVPSPYEGDGWIYLERFQNVEKVLFQNLVLEPISLGNKFYGEVLPDIAVELRNSETAPIMLNRELDSGYWDFHVKTVTQDVKMVFICFFDWDVLRYHDNQYVRVKIVDWKSHPELINKHALIEFQYIKFSLNKVLGCKTDG